MNTNRRQELEAFWKQSDAVKAKFRIAYKDIAVFCGEDVNTNTRSACRKAAELVGSGLFKKALIINTSANQRWALRIARDVSSGIGDDQNSDTICMIGIEQGELSRNIQQITALIERCGFDVVLINSWEMASANHRLREELIFSLHRLTSLGTSVVIYSQAAPKEYRAGKMLRGLGKLSALASSVMSLAEQEEAATVSQSEVASDRTASEKAPLSEQYIGAAGKLNAKSGAASQVHAPPQPIHTQSRQLVPA